MCRCMAIHMCGCVDVYMYIYTYIVFSVCIYTRRYESLSWFVFGGRVAMLVAVGLSHHVPQLLQVQRDQFRLRSAEQPGKTPGV